MNMQKFHKCNRLLDWRDKPALVSPTVVFQTKAFRNRRSFEKARSDHSE
jgi:hypothetical protein